MGRAISFPLPGLLYRDWRRLRSMTSEIAPRHRRRAAVIGIRSILNEAMHFQDQAQFGRRLAEQAVKPPIIILGLARSGTTLLHQLLSQDPLLAYPTVAQASHPHTFLTREGHTAGLGAKALRAANLVLSRIEFGQPEKTRVRGPDNVLVGPKSPEEEEFALLNSLQSKLLSFCFPRDFPASSEIEDKENWQRAWYAFLRKLSLIHPDRRLALKSPWHMARLRWILELFPDAKFVFISRQPGEIFRSTMVLYGYLFAFYSLQSIEGGWTGSQALQRIEDDTLQLARQQILGYLDDRHRIRAGHLHEIRYEDLVRDPEAQLEKLYRSLSLPGFESYRGRLREALREREGYQPNTHWELTAGQQERLKTEWSPYYEAFGYSP